MLKYKGSTQPSQLSALLWVCSRQTPSFLKLSHYERCKELDSCPLSFSTAGLIVASMVHATFWTVSRSTLKTYLFIYGFYLWIYGSRGHCQPLWKEFPLLKKYCYVFSQGLLIEHHLLLLHWCFQLLVSLWHWWAALITCPTRQGALRSVPLPLFAGIQCDNDSGAEICLRCLTLKKWGKSAELWSWRHKAECITRCQLTFTLRSPPEVSGLSVGDTSEHKVASCISNLADLELQSEFELFHPLPSEC